MHWIRVQYRLECHVGFFFPFGIQFCHGEGLRETENL